MNKELEQIAKQVSLLNRLLELLRMQENISESGYCTISREFSYHRGQGWWGFYKKAWSDELVKVAKAYKQGLLDIALFESTGDSEIYNELLTEYKKWGIGVLISQLRKASYGCYTQVSLLEAILNKYNRSLSE